MKILFRATIGALLAFGPSIGHARALDLKTESFAAYFAGTYGSSKAGDTTYAASVGTDISSDKQMTSAASGELGFLFPGEVISLRIGFEYLLPKALNEIALKNASGTPIVSTNAKVTALIPMVSLEFPAFKDSTSRAIVGVGAGMAFVDIENTHTLTAAGQARFPTLAATQTESGSGQGIAAQVYGGYEFLLTDTVTIMGSAGYRYAKIAELKSGKSMTTFYGSQAEGASLLNADGGTRGVDLSGFFGGIALRFYLGF